MSTDFLHGWITLKLGASMGHRYVALYRTVDGGRTWERIIDPGSPNSADLHTCCQSGMAFADDQNGLVTFSQGPNAAVVVDWTHDGGSTWQSQQLPPPVQPQGEFTFDGTACGTFSPVLFSSSSAALVLECMLQSSPEGQSTAFLYRTEDGGRIWHTDPYPGGTLLFLDPDVGWALGHEIYQTRDGGRTWTWVNQVTWDGQFSFTSEGSAWAVARSGGDVALVRTDDGWETWTEMHPRVASFSPVTTCPERLNMATYQADDLYQIDYPQNLYSLRQGISILSVLAPGVIVLEPTDALNSSQIPVVTYRVSIAVRENEANRSLDDAFDLLSSSSILQYDPGILASHRIQETVLGGVRAISVEDLEVGLAGITRQIVAIHDGKIYDIVVEPYQLSGDASAFYGLVEDILSSFSFP